MPINNDEYISSEKSDAKPVGLYRVERGENGSQKIFFDAPNKPEHTDGKGKAEVNGKTDRENMIVN